MIYLAEWISSRFKNAEFMGFQKAQGSHIEFKSLNLLTFSPASYFIMVCRVVDVLRDFQIKSLLSLSVIHF